MENSILTKLKQRHFELETKDKIIEEQNNELEQQQTLITNLKDELQHLKTEADIKLEMQNKTIEKLKIELEVYITEIKKKMKGWKKKQESHANNPIQRNCNTTAAVEVFYDRDKMPTQFTSGFEIKTENNPAINANENPKSIQEHKMEFSNNDYVIQNSSLTQTENNMLKIVNHTSEIYGYKTEKDFQPTENFSEIKIHNTFTIKSEAAEITTFPIDTISASEQNEPFQTFTSENEMEVLPNKECTERKSTSKGKIGNTFKEAKLNSSLTAKDSIGGCNQENVSIKKSKLTQCKTCSKAFQGKHNLKRHIETVHYKMKAFECNICSVAFGQRGSLETHVNSVHNKLKTCECPICSKSFARNYDLKIHIDTVHHKLKPFTCQICYCAFGQKSYLKIHVDTVHNNLKAFECKICLKAYKSKDHLKAHIGAVHQKLKPFTCPICSQKFGYRSDLKSHDDYVHKNLRPFKCTICEKAFPKNAYLKIHFDTAHKKL